MTKQQTCVKRAFDLVLASLGMVIIAPIMLVLMFLIRLDSKGPVFYGHKRLGLNGNHFKVWKFRSMVVNADKQLASYLNKNPQLRMEWEKNCKLKHDPRITRIGKILRRTSLDELPQIWNVLRGEMSLVGPRPIVDAEIAKYGPAYQVIKTVSPGMTGLWQVSGRSEVSYDKRVSLDIKYIKSWSVINDILILANTVRVIIKKKGAY
jgi:Undecaprenyl-phosphate galactose phosphotransferase WbaP